MSGVLALVAAPRDGGAAVTEFLRTLAALRAVDVPVDLREVGKGAGTLSREPDLEPDGQRYLEALRADGVEPRPAGDLSAAVSEADALLLLADPGRPGAPPLLRLLRGARPSEESLAALGRAGQVVLG